MATRTESPTSYEHPEGSGILIRVIDNQTSGKAFGHSFMVDAHHKATGNGRIRKQFRDERKAREFAAKVFTKKKEQGTAFMRVPPAEWDSIASLAQILRENQLTAQQVEPIIRLIPDALSKGIDLKECFEDGMSRIAPAKGVRTVAEVVAEFIGQKEEAHLRDSTLNDLKVRTKPLQAHIGDRPIARVDMPEIETFIRSFKGSPRTRENYLRTVAQVWAFADRKGYVAQNPIDKLTKEERRILCGPRARDDITVLTVDEAERLMRSVRENDPEWLAVITLQLFAGLRTEEISRLEWAEIDFSRDWIVIKGHKAKTGAKRFVTLTDNAKAWLSSCANREGRVAPFGGKKFENKLADLRKSAGWVNEQGGSTWPSNAARHSFASYHLEMTGSAEKTAQQLGHRRDLQMLFQHYADAVQPGTGAKYFAIKPAANAAKVVGMAG